MADKPACAAAADFVFDPTTCCYPCKPTPVDPSQCTETATAEALRALRPCLPGEEPARVPGLCTLSCAPSGVPCDPSQIKDRSDVRLCVSGQEPVFDGCEPNCRVPPPPCTPVCANTDRCVPSVTNALVAFKCENPTRCRTFFANGIDSSADPSDVLKQIIMRHCQDAAAFVADRCEDFAKRLLNSIVCTKTDATRTDEDGKVFTGIKCCWVPDPALTGAAAGRRLLGSDDLVTGATNDNGATGGVTFQAEQTGSASALTAFAGLSALFLAVA